MQINKNQLIELDIEKNIYEGYGLARLVSDEGNFVFFIDGACEGDKIVAEITKVKKNFAYGIVHEILTPSKHRVKPFCPLFNACGGCQWQFIDYKHQLEIKNRIVMEIINKTLKENIVIEKTLPSPEIKGYRHKVQMPVSQTKNSKRFLIGYYKPQTHELTNIKYCPIQPKIIDEINEIIRTEAQNLNLSAYNELTHKGELRHIIYRISKYYDDIILCFVVNNNKISEAVKKLAEIIYNKFERIKGVSVNYNCAKTNVILGEITENIEGEDILKEKIGDIQYLISPESFFQVNPESFKNILDTVKEQIIKRIKKPEILDAYSGVGSFGLYLSGIAKSITCVEENIKACINAKNACGINNIKNTEILNGDAKKIFEELISENKKFDVIILDPPRKGCSSQAVEFCNKLTDKLIIYVSCNPNTLARDLKLFENLGFEISYIQTADMFCHTYHIETIAVIEKKQALG